MAQQSWIVVQTPQGLRSTGCACDTSTGQITRTDGKQGYLAGLAGLTPSAARQRGMVVLSNEAYAQALAAKAANPALANPYGAVDVPGAGISAVGRAETPGNFSGTGLTYSIIFTNNQVGAVNTYRIFGDWPGTYAIAQGLVPVVGDTLVIGGSAATLSLSHLTLRAQARPFRVSQLQLQALSGSFFTSNPILYFDTTTSPQSGVMTNQLGLSALLSPNQFNDKIQIYDVSQLFDGVNGLRFNIPAGEVVTATFSVVSESSIHNMKLFNS